jgi:hypothetical protein
MESMLGHHQSSAYVGSREHQEEQQGVTHHLVAGTLTNHNI